MNDKELYQFALDNGLLNEEDLERLIETKKREEYLNNHNFKIWQGKDGYWRTYLPDSNKKRKMIKKKRKEDLEQCLIDYYKALVEEPTVSTIFEDWNARRLKLGKISRSTYERNRRIFERHYANYGKARIKDLEPRDFADFLEEQIAEYEMTAKAFSNLKSITKGFLNRACINGFIDYTAEDVFCRLDLTETSFKRTIKEAREEIYDEKEMDKMLNYLIHHPDPANLCICLMFVSGLRVGEAVAMRNEDLDDLSLKVRRTETRYKDDDGNTLYAVKEFPKSAAGVRTVPIPKDYAWLLKRIRHLNPFGGYVFLNNKGQRMTSNTIRSRLRTVCKHLKIYPKSPHKIRKTYATILLDNNIDHRLITDLMGHTDILTTEIHYHRDRKSLIAKGEILSNISDFKLS